MKKFIVANWKMNKTVAEAQQFVKYLRPKLKMIQNVDTAICASFTLLNELKKVLKGSGIARGGQNMHYEDKGAFTGEISAVQLKEFCEYVILGHSERRQYFNEGNSVINRKVHQALKHELKPILCVGERLEERKEKQTFDVIKQQIYECLYHVAAKNMNSVTIAYEPVWAIGTGVNAIPEQAEEVHHYIRTLLQERYPQKIAQSIRILYGGSVNPENTRVLITQPNINGALVGGASLDPEKFYLILKEAQ